MKYTITYGTRTIKYRIIRTDRKTFGVAVYPDGDVIVSAPLLREIPEIQERFKRKLSWVNKHMRAFERYQVQNTPRKFISGETHRYLGKAYRLKVVKSVVDRVSIGRGYITVWTKDTSKVQVLLDVWYRERLSSVVESLVKKMIPKFKRYGVSIPEIRIRTMSAKWGSCSRKGVLSFNVELVKQPTSLISYVIDHELCHLVHFNHTDEFYILLSHVRPQWKKDKRSLDENGIL